MIQVQGIIKEGSKITEIKDFKKILIMTIGGILIEEHRDHKAVSAMSIEGTTTAEDRTTIETSTEVIMTTIQEMTGIDTKIHTETIEID